MILLRKNLLIVVVCILVLSLCAVGNAAVEDIVMGSSQEGSASYGLSAALSTAAIKYSDKINVLPKPFGGTVDGLRALEKGRIDTNLIMYDILSSLVHSTGSFKEIPFTQTDKVQLNGVVTSAAYVFMVKKELAEEIKCIQDLAGRKVWLGAPMTGPRDLGIEITKALGISDKIREMSFDYKSLSDAIKNGQVEAIMTYGASTRAWPSYFIELEARNHMTVIPLTEEDVDKITNAIPLLGKLEWNYPKAQLVHDIGPDKGLSFINYTSYITLKGLMSEEAGFEWAKVVYEHAEELATGGAILVWGIVDLSIDDQINAFKIANKMGVPLHPGLAKYFKEFRGVDLVSEGVIVGEE